MTKTKKRMRQLTIKEISGVDQPAVEPGVVDVILKRADLDAIDVDADRADVIKNMGAAALTSANDGHSHLLDAAMPSGHTTWDGEPGGHSHPFVVSAEGHVVIGEAMRHSHEIAAISKAAVAGGGSNTEADMAQNIDKSAGTEDEQAVAIEKLTKELETAKAIGALNDAEKAHFQGLDEDGQTEFLAKSAEDRAAVIVDLAKGTEVIYKGKDGTEYRASDDPRTVALAKRLDEQVEKTDKERAERFESDIRKRAETELVNLPGELDVKVALLKAAESIPDKAQRKAAVDALKAQNAEMAKAMDTVGSRGGNAQDGDTAQGELDTLAKTLSEKEGIDYFTAYDRVSESNPQLVTKALTGR